MANGMTFALCISRCGIGMVQEILSKLTSDERWGVMVEFEQVCPDGFAQLMTDAPQWVAWMG